MPPRKKQTRTSRKRSAKSTSPSRSLKKIRRTDFDDVPEVIDKFETTLRDPRDWSKIEGMPWARKNGFADVKRVKRKDALEILNFLHITCEDEFRDGYGDLTAYNNPWSWLQQYSEAGGDLQNLSIRPRI